MPSSAPLEYLLLGTVILLLMSILASKASGRLGVPALLLFLIIGMLAGFDGPGRQRLPGGLPGRAAVAGGRDRRTPGHRLRGG
jgi:hypothetical protein